MRRAKKGQANAAKWQRNNKTPSPLKDIGPCCCNRECFNAIDLHTRNTIRSSFSKMTRSEQQIYMAGLIKVTKRDPSRIAMSIRRRRAREFECRYHLPSQTDQRVHVCKHEFKRSSHPLNIVPSVLVDTLNYLVCHTVFFLYKTLASEGWLTKSRRGRTLR